MVKKIEEDFMKFMEDNYNVNFIDSGEKPKAKPKESLPPEWRGMFMGYKRDAMYYEKCLRDLRLHYGGAAILEDLRHVLQQTYELDGVDLDKPNYGMF